LIRVVPDNAARVLAILKQEPVLSCDTETTGLEETDTPFACIVANETDEFYFDERNYPGFWENPQLKELYDQPSKLWAFQNAKFDMRMLRQRAIDTGGMAFDIAIAARIKRNDYYGSRAYSLDAQAKRIGRAKDDRVEKYIKANKLHNTRKDFFGNEYTTPQYDKVPLELMEQYACQDARLTYDLYKKYTAEFDSDDSKVMMNEVKLTKVCFNMERTGMKLNQEYTLKAYYYEKDKLAECRAAYKLITGCDYVNSAKSIGPHLDGYQLPLTADGNPSLTDDVLEDIMAVGTPKAKQVARSVQSIRFLAKRIDTYYVNYLNMMDKGGIIHPTMWQAGTRTGRFSYSEPNLQNIPKEEGSGDEFVIRGCYQPRPGNVFVSFDYSQMEYKMMAAYANQRSVIEQIAKGMDFHQAVADMTGLTRQQAKTLNFAILYGAGAEKIAQMLGCSTAEAYRLKLKYFMALPRVEDLVDEVIRIGKQRGFVKNWFGRKLYAEPNFCYALPNHLIQGGGADVVKIAMNTIADELPEMPMVLQVHDQLVLDIHPDQFKDLGKVQEIMESTFPTMNGVRLTVDVSWSNKSLAERDMVEGMPDGSVGHATV
jgi:DNA polymerase-1